MKIDACARVSSALMFGHVYPEVDRLKLEMRGVLGLTPEYLNATSIVPAIEALASSKCGVMFYDIP
jgi:hypothetical protein